MRLTRVRIPSCAPVMPLSPSGKAPRFERGDREFESLQGRHYLRITLQWPSGLRRRATNAENHRFESCLEYQICPCGQAERRRASNAVIGSSNLSKDTILTITADGRLFCPRESSIYGGGVFSTEAACKVAYRFLFLMALNHSRREIFLFSEDKPSDVFKH